MSKEKILTWVAAIVLPVVLFIISPYWAASFDDEKRLEYFVVAKTELGRGGLGHERWPGLAVSFEGTPIEEGGIISVGLRNSGTIPILAKDFDKPIRLELSEDSSVVWYRLAEESPDALGVNASPSDNVLAVDPLLLNPNDYFILDVLVQGDLAVADVESRVAGVRSIDEYRPEREREGIYVEHVLPDPESNGSIHSSIARIDPAVGLPAASVVLSLTLLAINVVKGSSGVLRIYALSTGALCYIVSGMLMAFSVVPFRSQWLLVGVALFAVVFFAALLKQSLIRYFSIREER